MTNTLYSNVYQVKKTGILLLKEKESKWKREINNNKNKTVRS